MIRLLLLAFLSILLFEGVVFAESGPVFSDTGPDAEAYGASKGYPVPPFEYPPGVRQDFMIGTYSHFDKVHSMRTVPKPATPSVLKRTAEEIVPVYHYDGRQKAIGDYLDTHPVTGLLIARGDTILFEHYRYARSDQDRLLSNSMAKTITALLVGIATSEGAIRSIDDTAATYVPELAGTEYGATPLRALPISQTMTLSIFIRRCWGIIRSVRLPRFAKSTRATRHRIHALPMPVQRQRYSASSSAVRPTCRLPTILRRGSGKSSVPSPTPPGLSIQQGKKWLTAASSPRYATGHA